MFGQIDTMRMAQDMGAHAAARQRAIAANVANADTPGYRARDLPDFASQLRSGPPVGLRTTRADHLAASSWGSAGGRTVDAGGEASPNGNTVTLEGEMLRAAEAKRQFDLSLSIYQSGMGLMRTALGRRG